jgi:hypothetical protein
MATYEKLGNPGVEIAEPRYVVSSQEAEWGAARIGYKSLLVAIQLHYSIPASEFPAYLLNNKDEQILILRVSGIRAAETLTVKDVYELRHGPESWNELKKRVRKGVP